MRVIARVTSSKKEWYCAENLGTHNTIVVKAILPTRPYTGGTAKTGYYEDGSSDGVVGVVARLSIVPYTGTIKVYHLNPGTLITYCVGMSYSIPNVTLDVKTKIVLEVLALDGYIECCNAAGEAITVSGLGTHSGPIVQVTFPIKAALYGGGVIGVVWGGFEENVYGIRAEE